jgi:hypothetical protein
MLILNMFHFFRLKALIFFLLCCLAALNAENKQVVTEMQLTTNDSLFKYNYIYNDRIVTNENSSALANSEKIKEIA